MRKRRSHGVAAKVGGRIAQVAARVEVARVQLMDEEGAVRRALRRCPERVPDEAQRRAVVPVHRLALCRVEEPAAAIDLAEPWVGRAEIRIGGKTLRASPARSIDQDRLTVLVREIDHRSATVRKVVRAREVADAPLAEAGLARAIVPRLRCDPIRVIVLALVIART